MFAKYRALPVVVPEPEIAAHVADVLRAEDAEANEAVSSLYELIKRQDHYWRPLAPEVVGALDAWMVEAWRRDPDLDLDTWATLVRVGDGTDRDPGTPRAMALLREIAAGDPRPGVRAIAAERLGDIQDDARGCERETGRTYPAVFTGRGG
jgi:hypothetical protein